MSVTREDISKLNALRVETLYNNTAIPVAVTLTGCVVLFFVLLDEKNSAAAYVWLSLLLIISFVRFLLVKRYHATQKDPDDYPHWLKLFVIGTVCSGLLLGSTAYVFIVDDDIINIGLLTMFILVLNSGSIGIYSAFKRVYYSFNIPAALPLAVYLFSQGNAMLNKLGMIFVAFIVFIFVIQYHAHQIIIQMISIQLDNQNLLSSYELDQSRINIMERLFNTNQRELETTKLKLKDCEEKLKQQG